MTRCGKPHTACAGRRPGSRTRTVGSSKPADRSDLVVLARRHLPARAWSRSGTFARRRDSLPNGTRMSLVAIRTIPTPTEDPVSRRCRAGVSPHQRRSDLSGGGGIRTHEPREEPAGSPVRLRGVRSARGRSALTRIRASRSALVGRCLDFTEHATSTLSLTTPLARLVQTFPGSPAIPSLRRVPSSRSFSSAHTPGL